MKVHQIIEELSKLDQDAYVEIYGGYDPEYGLMYQDIDRISQEPTGWDDANQCQIFTVFIE